MKAWCWGFVLPCVGALGTLSVAGAPSPCLGLPLQVCIWAQAQMPGDRSSGSPSSHL